MRGWRVGGCCAEGGGWEMRIEGGRAGVGRGVGRGGRTEEREGRRRKERDYVKGKAEGKRVRVRKEQRSK